MNKRMLLMGLMLVGVLLMVSSSFAQSSRDADYQSEGKTVYTDLAVVGLNVSGVPGYIEFDNGNEQTYYLYVNKSGQLMIASAITVGSVSSPQVTTWSPTGYLGLGSKVGAQ